MNPNKHFSSKFLSELLCHNRKKCYMSPGAITLSARLKPSSRGGFLPQGIKGNDIPALRCLTQREMRVPQGTLEHLVTDRIFVSYGKHPCIHTTGYIVGPLKKMPDNLLARLPVVDHLQNPGHDLCPHPTTAIKR